ncbi:hypothetical protein PG999_014080 [Apiospora kogelbergensis]|uniref:SNF2 N-terminal domain-containing protein n=1 Tax=Apiospora kogelbergensis TaxID=1337665 RepID=A0AAW0Q822_9PEZI
MIRRWKMKKAVLAPSQLRYYKYGILFIQIQDGFIFLAVMSLQAKHRWCLTGTPIQNLVQDFGSLVEFLRLDTYSTRKMFKAPVIDPIG